jgi:proline racemase
LPVSLSTIDAHSSGDPLRLIVSGFPAPKGRSMRDKRDWVAGHADDLRQILLLEPRGHADMRGAVLTEPVAPGSHAGILFLDADGYPPMSGHAIVAATTIALDRGLIAPGGDGCTIVFDTPAGVVRARAVSGAGQTESVSFENVPSFVLHGGIGVRTATRMLRADIAFGGAFYAIVDSEAAGVGVDAPHASDLRRAAIEIIRAVESTHHIVHPLDPSLIGVHGVIFTGPASDGQADLRSATVSAGGRLSRSPSGTGTSAVMAVLDAMGLLDTAARFAHESIIGTRFTGRISSRTSVGEYAAIVPEITGSAWVTGEHTFVANDADPLRTGFRI